ncbi:metallophosphoesterase family protein [Dokdonella soli]|uniref:Phosphoesterase n=1 Tax=Dokdonella soli TaxID=529810 RepID=A0ABN1IC49_9GAMM
MRVLLLSDTHGTLDARIAALAHDSDLVVHAGDVGSAQVLSDLRKACPSVIAVRGNNDVPAKWGGEQAALRTLEDHAEIELPGGVLVAVHGDRFPAAQRHARLRAAFPGARAIVYGHSHRIVIDDGALPWVLNPGAAGHARTFGGPSCLRLTATARRWNIELSRFAGSSPPSAAVQARSG